MEADDVPGKKSSVLTDAELRLMDVVWAKGAATVSDVVDALPKEAPLHYSTVLTFLRILENKGYLTHIQNGRAFIYSPKVKRAEACANAVDHLLKRFFDGSPALLMLKLMEDRKIDPKELKRLRKRIAEEES
jgi:predicted transcriptional regulator